MSGRQDLPPCLNSWCGSRLRSPGIRDSGGQAEDGSSPLFSGNKGRLVWGACDFPTWLPAGSSLVERSGCGVEETELMALRGRGGWSPLGRVPRGGSGTQPSLEAGRHPRILPGERTQGLGPDGLQGLEERARKCSQVQVEPLRRQPEWQHRPLKGLGWALCGAHPRRRVTQPRLGITPVLLARA